ncbi:hypothetical protein OTU49_017342 [Cherax quadricarinatus]|uniref:Uncharacterized protein n=1 Tax=Cherax quadricarinatus TaxID=27406 RepID=A0AAW0XPG2_CHEQU|nr:uncharacterized protein LOC128689416 isoform X2 [Cherax quadricarinatus]
MTDTASPSPPASPTPSSSDDAPHILHTPTTSLASPSPVPSSSSSEPSSSTSCSNSPIVGESSGGCNSDGCEVTSGASTLEDPGSSRHRVESLITLDPPSSSIQFSPEVSSSNLGLDENSLSDAPHSFAAGANGSTSPRAPDSSEAATGSSHFRFNWQPRSSCPNLVVPSSSGWPQECLRPMSESLVSRSTWLSSSSSAATGTTGTPSSWHSGAFWGSLEASDVSSTGPPDSTKSTLEACQVSWQREYPSTASDELTSSTTLSHETVNSTIEVGATSSSWSQEGEGATAATWECDSLNSEVGATSSLSSWPPSSSTSTSQSTLDFASPSNTSPSNPPVNSTSQCPPESSLQLHTWRSRVISAPLSLTRVMPTAPPPRPPTPPRQPTPPTSRHRSHIQPPMSLRRSVSPPAQSYARVQSPSAVRRSLSPPQLQYAHHVPPVRRSASPPHHHAHAAQPPTPPRRSVSPVSFQGVLGQPLSPTVRRRTNHRHRSARTPSPRPPRPPNSTPASDPAPSQQQSPRPHSTKMRGR